MGSVYQRGARWWLKWRDAANRVQRRSTTAKTRRDALELLRELEGGVERVKLGLQARPAQSKLTVRALVEWYLENRCPEASRAMATAAAKKHIFGAELAGYSAAVVTADHIEAQVLEVMERNKLAPATVNRVRTIMAAAFSAASKPPRKFHGANPVADTRVRAVERVERPTLTPEQIEQLLQELTGSLWQGVVAVAVYLGLRRGEIFALRRGDYDAKTQTLRVMGSHQRRITKGGTWATLPVPAVLRPYLDEAQRARNVAPSLWLFPREDGQQRTRESDPHLVVRRALVRMGIASAWETWCLTCQRAGRTNVEKVKGTEKPKPARCTIDGHKRRVRADPLRFRFHDLRHTCATNLLRAGVPLVMVSRILRHANITMTANTYGHLEVEDLRQALNTIPPSAAAPASAREVGHNSGTKKGR